MRKLNRSLWSVVVVVAAALALSACGSSSSSSTQPTSGDETATVVEGTFPQSLDPSINITTEGGEVHWLTHLGPYTFAHASGAAGTEVIPAIATALPTVSDDGKTYEFTIRKGLKYSDGSPVKASDLAFGIKRALKLGWGAASFLTSTIVGADDFATGKAQTIPGITTDDASGKVAIHLVKPYGAFEDVLAVPGVTFLPQSTPMKPQPNDPPPGFGPYEIENVVPNVSFDLTRNPAYPAQAIPGIPAGHMNIHVKVQSNTTTEASEVLNNSADVFDWADTIPPALIQQVSGLTDRFEAMPINKTFYWFLNVTSKPFNNQLAREAVDMAVDRPALARLSSGTLAPGCYLLPPDMPGHPTQPCPHGDPSVAPNIAAAKKLVEQSGMAGEPVTVWAENRQPRLEWAENYAATLNEIGFKATLKTIADADYFANIETLKNHPQTGFDDWQQDFPNPTDFYQTLIDGRAIAPLGNGNASEVNDPFIQGQLDQLYPVRASELGSVESKWEALDYYVTKKAYVVPFGYLTAPKFVSDRINFDTLVFSPLQGNDFSSLELK